jgi:phage RecT family recombinase
MGTELAVLEAELKPRRASFAALLAPYPELPPSRLERSVLMAYENNVTLRECALNDIINCAQTAACLGLTVDGVSGQAWILPFNDRKSGRMRAQLIPGYRGYATIGARSRLSINAELVRQGDSFNYERGTKGYLRHKPKLGGEQERAIEAAWATAEAYDRPSVWTVMSIDVIRGIRDRSPGFRSGGGAWRSDFGAMARKTPIRDLARFMPMSTFTLTAHMENLHEHHGVPVNITPDGELLVEAALTPHEADARNIPNLGEINAPPKLIIRKEHSSVPCSSIADWRGKMLMAVEALPAEALQKFLALNAEPLAEYARGYPGDVAVVKEAADLKLGGAT